MKLYTIRDWEKHYENSRSRVIENLRWVPIPNRHDGETFGIIMAHKDGAAIFTGWILLLQIASKCSPRGVLIRGNGAPHNVTSLSLKCRAPVTLLSLSLNYLENETDWLEVKESEELTETSLGYHPPVTRPSPARHPSAEEGRNRKKEGRNDSPLFHEAIIPSWKEFQDACDLAGGVAEWYARDKFEAANVKRWNGIADIPAYARRVHGWFVDAGSPTKPVGRNGQPVKNTPLPFQP